MVSIDHHACNGCGFCIENCPTYALQLMDGLVELDETLCQVCEICIDVCPKGAITLSEVIEDTYPVVVTAAPLFYSAGAAEELPDLAIVKPPIQRSTEVITKPQKSLGDLLGAVLAFLARDIAPAVEDFLRAKRQYKTNPTPTQSHFVNLERGSGAGKRRRGQQVRRRRQRRR